MTSALDPYAEFLAEQRKREAEWSSHRAKKQARITEVQNKDFEEIKQQLAAQQAECTTLKSQLDCLQRANVSVVEAVHNKVQKSFCKVSTMMAFNLHFQKHIKRHHKNIAISFPTSKMSECN